MEKEEDDELRYKLKRKYIGIFEILVVLYNNNRIPDELIVIIINRLLKLKNINYDIECLHKLIDGINISNIDKKILNELYVKFKKIDIKTLPSRIKFLSYDISDKFEGL